MYSVYLAAADFFYLPDHDDEPAPVAPPPAARIPSASALPPHLHDALSPRARKPSRETPSQLEQLQAESDGRPRGRCAALGATTPKRAAAPRLICELSLSLSHPPAASVWRSFVLLLSCEETEVMLPRDPSDAATNGMIARGAFVIRYNPHSPAPLPPIEAKGGFQARRSTRLAPVPSLLLPRYNSLPDHRQLDVEVCCGPRQDLRLDLPRDLTS